MSENREPVTLPRDEAGDADSTPAKKLSRKFLALYASVLFAVALGMILLSYFSQRRMNEEAISALNAQHELNSSSALQNIQNLIDVNEQMSMEIDDLTERLASLQIDIDTLNAVINKNQAEFDAEKVLYEQRLSDAYKTVEALVRFSELEQAYGKREYTAARGLLSAFRQDGLDAFLPGSDADSDESLAGRLSKMAERLER